MDFPPRFVSVLCLVQLSFITGGYFITYRFLKLIYDGPAPDLPTRNLATFVCNYGLWFLLIPAVWALIAVMEGQVTRSGVSITKLHLIAGIALTIAIVVTFSLSARNAFFSVFHR